MISYIGSIQERRDVQDWVADGNEFNVIITTYNIATGSKEDRHFLRHSYCKSMILDEGHMMKNSSSLRYKNLMKFNIPFRLLLTGTPLQNDLIELLSLLTFIMPELFEKNAETLSKLFSYKKDDLSSTDTSFFQERIERAKKMMAPFILRRRKDQVRKAKLILGSQRFA